ncbi:MAG: hypothetical protein HN350_07690 [Phycisphaerales bacterium]|jgi:hypothetical protein|nr:hypothetical protein [Phycisphaerales bacterium]
MNCFRNILLLVAMSLTVWCLSGCQDDNPLDTGQGKPPVIKPSESDIGKPPRFPEIIRLNVVTVEVPAGQASGSEEIWSYLDEEPIGAERLVLLGRNGVRVGLGRDKSMPDIIRVLTRMTGDGLGRRLMVGRRGSPHHITLKRDQGIQTIFMFHSDRTLSGDDMPAGDNVLSVACTVDENDANRMILTGMPQVRSTKTKTRFRSDAGGVRIVNNQAMFGFRDLMFQMPMKAGEFLVIGPGAAARRPHSVGRHFLVAQKQGMDFETVLVITPRAEMLPQSPKP